MALRFAAAAPGRARESILVTGVRRDTSARASEARPGDELTVLDISLAANARDPSGCWRAGRAAAISITTRPERYPGIPT
jgi:hypothetical protein